MMRRLDRLWVLLAVLALWQAAYLVAGEVTLAGADVAQVVPDPGGQQPQSQPDGQLLGAGQNGLGILRMAGLAWAD